MRAPALQESKAPSSAVDEAMREIADRLERRLPDLREIIFEQLCAEIPEYRAVGQTRSGWDVRDSITSLVGLFVCVRRDGRRLMPAELSALAALAKERANQGVPLDSLLRALRIAMKVGWEDTTEWLRNRWEEPAFFDAVAVIAFDLLEFIDDITKALGGSYIRQREAALGDLEQRRRAFVNDCLRGEIDNSADARTRAVALGFDISASHGIVVATRTATQAMQRRTPAIDVMSKGVFILEVFESGTPIEVTIVRTYDDEAWESALESMRSQLAGTAMLGLYAPPLPGLARMHRAYERLRRLLPLAVTVFDPGTLHPADEVGIFGLLGAASAEDRASFLQATLGPVLRLAEVQRQPLLETMQALFDHRGSPMAAARALCIHRKTINYRKTRISDLTGLSWAVPAERLRLDLALHLFRLSGGKPWLGRGSQTKEALPHARPIRRDKT